MNKRILIIGACGQIGTELTLKLREIHGEDTVIASDIREGNKELMKSGPFEFINAIDYNSILEIMLREGKSNKLSHVSIALSPLMFSTKFIDYSMKRVFQKDMIPIIPLSGVDSKLFEEAKEIGLEKQIPKLKISKIKI